MVLIGAALSNSTAIPAKNKFDATVAPAVTDDSDDGYEVGSVWIDVSADKSYTAVDVTVGAAVWIETSAGAAGGAPTDAKYIVQQANGSLTQEQALGALATGILKNTTTTGVLSIAAAGTDYAAASHTHNLADVSDVTASAAEVNIMDGVTASTAEINFTDGVTSAIQTQLDGKQATITGLTASGAELNILDGATLDTTELNYVDGVTSAIQTQIDGKQATLVSGTNIKTINGSTVLGSGDLTVSGSMPRGHLWGLTMSNAADAINDITVAAGEARSDDNTTDMTLAAAITKRIDAGWAVGDNQGGLNTGVVNDSTWYEVHLIKRTDTGVVDVMFTTTANRATLPTNYTKKRRIGWIRRSAVSANLAFTQVDDHFTLTIQVNDVSATATTTAAAVTLTAPPNSIARFRAGTTSTTAVNTTNATIFSEIVEADVTPTETTGAVSIGASDIAGADGGHYELRVSATSTIEHDSDGATYGFDIATYGWIDHRGKMSDI